MESSESIHGRLKEGAHIAGYSLERALENFLWLLEEKRWKELGFESVNEFLRSVEGAFSQFRLLADQRKEIVKLIKDQEPKSSQRAIAEVVGASPRTVGEDLGKKRPVSDDTSKSAKEEKSVSDDTPPTSRTEGGKAAQVAMKDAQPSFYQSSESIEWSTPQWLFNLLDDEFGFEIDVCASKDNAKCKKFYTKEDDGLSRKWRGICWMNPPYGTEIADWMAKARESARGGATVVCLVPGAYETTWFRESALMGETRLIHNGRVKWRGMTAAPFPSAVIILSPNIEPKVMWWNVHD